MANTIGTGDASPRTFNKVILREIGGQNVSYEGKILKDRVSVGGNLEIDGDKSLFKIVKIKRFIKNVKSKTLLVQDWQDRKFLIRHVN